MLGYQDVLLSVLFYGPAGTLRQWRGSRNGCSLWPLTINLSYCIDQIRRDTPQSFKGAWGGFSWIDFFFFFLSTSSVRNGQRETDRGALKGLQHHGQRHRHTQLYFEFRRRCFVWSRFCPTRPGRPDCVPPLPPSSPSCPTRPCASSAERPARRTRWITRRTSSTSCWWSAPSATRLRIQTASRWAAAATGPLWMFCSVRCRCRCGSFLETARSDTALWRSCVLLCEVVELELLLLLLLLVRPTWMLPLFYQKHSFKRQTDFILRRQSLWTECVNHTGRFRNSLCSFSWKTSI